MNRRTQYEIYWEILTYCKTRRPITQIIQRCDLNSKIGQEHVNFLEEKQLLKKTSEDSKNFYITTSSAKGYLEKFMSLYLELFQDKPDFKL